MILGEYRALIAKRWCDLNGMDPRRIPQERVSDLLRFLNQQIKIKQTQTRQSEANASLKINSDTIAKIMNFSEHQSPIEHYLRAALEPNGLTKGLKIQFRIGKYRVDFAYPKEKLILECDGHAYHFTEKSQIKHDQERDKYFSRRGWRIIHFEGIAIRRNIEFCIKKTKEALGR